jgi:hypothetical protein
MILTAYKYFSNFEFVMVNRKSEWRGIHQICFFQLDLSVQNAPRFCKTYFQYYNIKENR